jgi:16S rRNA A1518/A1519 N6-dimethyltransferase RsmA/KsgA/DIM1 with predicted DNA glycosylase/AP lyase activity
MGDDRMKPCWFLYQPFIDTINPELKNLQHPTNDIQPRFKTKNMRQFLEAAVNRRKKVLKDNEALTEQLAQARAITKAATAAMKSKKKAKDDSEDEFDDLWYSYYSH